MQKRNFKFLKYVKNHPVSELMLKTAVIFVVSMLGLGYGSLSSTNAKLQKQVDQLVENRNLDADFWIGGFLSEAGPYHIRNACISFGNNLVWRETYYIESRGVQPPSLLKKVSIPKLVDDGSEFPWINTEVQVPNLQKYICDRYLNSKFYRGDDIRDYNDISDKELQQYLRELYAEVY